MFYVQYLKYLLLKNWKIVQGAHEVLGQGFSKKAQKFDNVVKYFIIFFKFSSLDGVGVFVSFIKSALFYYSFPQISSMS